MYKCAGHPFSFNCWHMARNTLAAGTAALVMCVLFECRSARAIRRTRTVAVEAYLVRWLNELRIILRSMHIMA